MRIRPAVSSSGILGLELLEGALQYVLSDMQGTWRACVRVHDVHGAGWVHGSVFRCLELLHADSRMNGARCAWAAGPALTGVEGRPGLDRESYSYLMSWLDGRPGFKKALSIANKTMTGATYVVYPCLLIWLLATGSDMFWRALLVPAISFVLVSMLRSKIDAQRPYEKFGIPSAVRKDTSGKSFPSRHVFSMSVIAMTFLACLPNPAAGIALLVLSIVLAAVRVLSGIHFVRDVACGFALGVLSGVIGFYLI